MSSIQCKDCGNIFANRRSLYNHVQGVVCQQLTNSTDRVLDEFESDESQNEYNPLIMDEDEVRIETGEIEYVQDETSADSDDEDGVDVMFDGLLMDFPTNYSDDDEGIDHELMEHNIMNQPSRHLFPAEAQLLYLLTKYAIPQKKN